MHLTYYELKQDPANSMQTELLKAIAKYIHIHTGQPNSITNQVLPET